MSHQISQAHAAIEALLPTLRASQTAVDGRLWRDLTQCLGLSDAEFGALMMDAYGIEVIDDGRWTHVEFATEMPALLSVPAEGRLCVLLSKRPILLCEDPWSAKAVSALGRGPRGLQLGLARPGQLAALSAKFVVAKPNGAAQRQTDVSGSAVVAFVDRAISRAYREGASDIHFETDRRGVGIKYRLDGVMTLGERFDDIQRAEEVLSRIKVLAQLDITERRRPQDGRIHWSQEGGESFDLRVSVMPSIFGEDAVLRLLDKAQLRHSQQAITLEALGFDQVTVMQLRALATRPHGMMLMTGPTGSGKTTTVYAALSEVNDGLEKIITIEDPVEYELAGVLQIPVNEQKGLTFATGLRSILRHDPDKILVGEIRDAETAEIAVQSSLTGHLVFTTVHANSMFDVLGRFQHFGIESFALASALNGVVVQRLLRRICSQCAGTRPLHAQEREMLTRLSVAAPLEVPSACGCERCRGTGYRGRFVVAEVHELSDAIRDMMISRASMSELKRAVYADPNSRLISQAVDRVREGQTTIEEIARVVGLV